MGVIRGRVLDSLVEPIRDQQAQIGRAKAGGGFGVEPFKKVGYFDVLDVVSFQLSP